MSRFVYLARIIVIAAMVSTTASAWAVGGYIFDAAGAVSISADKRSAPRMASKNDAVVAGSVVRTGDNSHAVLKFEDGQVVSLQANSTFQVREYRYVPRQAEESGIVFSMFKGGMRFITGQIGQSNPKAFRLATPHATVGIRGTDFMVVMANNATYSQVLSGAITVTNAAGMVVTRAGQTALTPSATTLTTLLTNSSAPVGTFSEIAAIPVPAPTPGPLPAPAVAGARAGASAATTAATTPAAAGGAAAGGAAASTAAVAGGASTGISATTIGIGIGVAALVAAAAHSSSTTHH